MRRLFFLITLGALGLAAQTPTPQGGEGPAPSSMPKPPWPVNRGIKPPPFGKTKKGKNNTVDELAKFSGRIVHMEDTQLVILTGDHRNVTFLLMKDTKFFNGDDAIALKNLELGQMVDVESNETEDEEFQAVNVRLHPAPASVVEKTPESATPDADAEARPKLKYGKSENEASAEPDDGAPPKLKHGKPEPGKRADVAKLEKPAEAGRVKDPESEDAATAKQPVEAANAPDPHQAFLREARANASEFTGSLPNFMCLELVTRYLSDNHAGTLWKPQDVVSTDLIWKDGQEEYRNLTIGGKKVDPEKVGSRSWSTGEFGTVLEDIFSPGSAAKLQYARATRLSHFNAVMYDFDIDLEHSHWLVREGGQSIRPAHTGTIWFDKDTKRVLRIELQAVEIPKEFPADTVELALDYDYVLLGRKKFLVPVRAESLACHRGMNYCTKNDIEFRNYHRFGSESEIEFEADQPAPALRPDQQKKK